MGSTQSTWGVKGKCIRSGFGNELAEVLGTEACKCVGGKCVFPKVVVEDVAVGDHKGACTGPVCSLEENEEKKSKEDKMKKKMEKKKKKAEKKKRKMEKKQMKKDKKKGKGDNKPTIVAPKLFDAAIEDPEDVVVEDVVVGDPMGPCTGPVCSLEENEEKKSKEEKKQKKMEKKKKKKMEKKQMKKDKKKG